MSDVKLLKDTDSTVVIVKLNKLRTYNIAEIRKIAFTGSGFWTGFLVGLGAGTAVSSFVILVYGGELIPFIFYGALWSIPIGVVGGIIGAVLAKDEIYIFEKGFTKSKSKKVNFIIEKHKQ